jgi:hypothetical protein
MCNVVEDVDVLEYRFFELILKEELIHIKPGISLFQGRAKRWVGWGTTHLEISEMIHFSTVICTVAAGVLLCCGLLWPTLIHHHHIFVATVHAIFHVQHHFHFTNNILHVSVA